MLNFICSSSYLIAGILLLLLKCWFQKIVLIQRLVKSHNFIKSHFYSCQLLENSVRFFLNLQISVTLPLASIPLRSNLRCLLLHLFYLFISLVSFMITLAFTIKFSKWILILSISFLKVYFLILQEFDHLCVLYYLFNKNSISSSLY